MTTGGEILSYSLVGNKLETPLVNAAGSINGTSSEQILREVDILSRTAIGAITVGSFTVPAQAGNEARFRGLVYFHDQETGATYNSMGLPNIGLAAAKQLMPKIVARAHDKRKPVIASVSPTHKTSEIGDTFKQVNRLVYELLLSGVDLIEVNTSCPNVLTEDGVRKPMLGYDLEGMQRLVEQLAPWSGTVNSQVGVKLPPYITDEEKSIIPELAKVFKEIPVFSFLVTSNTVALSEAKENALKLPRGSGGMSGAAMKEVGREQLMLWHENLKNKVEIVSTLGVDSGHELAVRRQLGATAAGGVTFLWESDSWGTAVTNMLTEWAENIAE